MFSEFPALFASLKTFGELINFAVESKTASAVREKAIESQSVLVSVQMAMLELQTEHNALLRQKSELENRLIEFANWKNEAAKYELSEPESGVFVYALKPEIEDAGPKHWLCPNCYQDQKKSILIRTVTDMEITLHCFKCGTNVLLREWPQF